MDLLKTLLFTILFLSCTGCAISGASRIESLELTTQKISDQPFNVNMSCPEKLYSIMGSVVIPLPPILPVFWMNEDVARLFVTTESNQVPSIAFYNSSGESIPAFPILVSNNKGTSGSEENRYYFKVNISCEALDGNKLVIAMEGKEYIFFIKYNAGHVKFEWAYLSA